jgi:hypothetical protein
MCTKEVYSAEKRSFFQEKPAIFSAQKGKPIAKKYWFAFGLKQNERVMMEEI